MTSLINYGTGEVAFDSDAFRDLMKFSKTYGSYDDGLEDDQEIWVDPNESIRNGDAAMVNSFIYNPSSYISLVTVYGEPVSVAGYPSATAGGPLCAITDSFSISSESTNVDACWSFIKSLLSEDAQMTDDTNSYEIPVLKTAFEAQIKLAMDPPQGGGNFNYDGQRIPPMTEKMAQDYRALVGSLDTIMIPDNAVNAIIMEEVPAYFNDQKTDTAVSALIQNRVETLVKERS